MQKIEKICLKVSAIDRGLRLDQYIIKYLPLSISRSRIQRLIKEQKVLLTSSVEDKVTVKQTLTKASYRVKENDTLLINIPEPPSPKALPEKIPLEIVFEDEDILVLNKPAGMVTHPTEARLSLTLVNALLGYGCALSTINGPLRPGIVHRLDKDTSGLLVIAKNDFAHQNLALQFQKHLVKRKYIAIVRGRLLQNEGVIDYPLARHPKDRRKIVVSFLKKSRPALTRYKVLKRFTDKTLVELMPHTGRTHQLRVHLKFCGHPILGDARYGSASEFKRLALHATELGFKHPRTKEFVEFQCEPPQCFRDLLISVK